MSSSVTTEAVRLALGLHELQARVAGLNIAHAGVPDARALRVDFAAAQAALRDAAHTPGTPALGQLQRAREQLAGLAPEAGRDAIQADEQVADMVEAGLGYQALGEALSRHFGLMRLAVTGRS